VTRRVFRSWISDRGGRGARHDSVGLGTQLEVARSVLGTGSAMPECRRARRRAAGSRSAGIPAGLPASRRHPPGRRLAAPGALGLGAPNRGRGLASTCASGKAWRGVGPSWACPRAVPVFGAAVGSPWSPFPRVIPDPRSLCLQPPLAIPGCGAIRNCPRGPDRQLRDGTRSGAPQPPGGNKSGYLAQPARDRRHLWRLARHLAEPLWRGLLGARHDLSMTRHIVAAM